MDKLLEEMSKMRRKFHKIAEPGWLEFETTIEIIDKLKSYGYKDIYYGKEIHSTRPGLPKKEDMKYHADKLGIERDYNIDEILDGYTGLIANLDTGNEGPSIGLRFDIDANDVPESTNDSHRPFKDGFNSKNPNAMHACGHDGHITIGLFIAKWIIDNKDSLKGNFRIIFQPAEEGVRGASSMVEAGMLKNLDYFLSGHIGLGVPSNTIGLGTTGFLATTKMDINFKGVSSHAGAKPEEGKNALLAAANCAINLHTLTQFSTGMSRLNVGKLEAGTGRNVVPGSANMLVETRGDKEDINISLIEKLENIVKGSSQMFDVEYEMIRQGSAPVYNGYDKELIDGITEYIGEKDYNLIYGYDFGGSEDVAYMLNEVEENGGRVLHMIFGSDLKAGHHNERFDFVEKDLLNAYDILKESINYICELE